MKKKILFDALILGKSNTGVARGVSQLLEKMKNKNNVYVLANKYFPLSKEKFNTINIPFSHLSIIRIPFQIFIIPLIIIFKNIKVYFSPTHILPIFKYGKYIVFMHDLMLYKVPKKYPFFKSILYHFYYSLILLNGDEFITPSKHTKKDLSFYTNKPIKVEPWQIGEIANIKGEKFPFKEKFDYILTVGSLEKGKNLDYLIKAYANLREDLKKNYKLVITGKNINSARKIMGLIKKYSLKNNVIFTGFVSDERLVSLYKHTSLFVFPSKYEGFGFPVLEAVYFGAPTICSDTSSLKELLTDPNLRFPLNNVNYLTELIEKMLK